MSDSEYDSEGKGDWEDWESDNAGPSSAEPAQSLFSSTVLPSIEAALAYDESNFGFNFAAYRKQNGLDDYETIKCINFIRSEVAAGSNPLTALAVAASGGPRPWQDEHYLQPVLSDDTLLFHEYDDATAADRCGGDDQAGPSGLAGSSTDVADLQQENAALRSSLEMLLAYVPDDVARELFNRNADTMDGVAVDMAGLELSEAQPAGNEAAPLVVRNKQRQAGQLADVARVDANYFDSYSSFNIHREMISDKVRTDAYQKALEGNPGLLKGAAVLDVGCGSGILSMFAARAGASRVIGVEGSDAMAGWAQKVVAANGLDREQGGAITIVAGRVEQLQSLPVEKVDVIVSEWMGYTLLFETMLDTVLYARDRWLKPGGALLPDVATMFIAAAGPGALDTAFWDSVYGFSMAPIGESVRLGCQGKAVVTAVGSQDLLTDTAAVQRFDLAAMTAADADFHADFWLRAHAQEPATLHAVVLWFDVEFSSRFCRQQPVVLSTSPCGPQTHWAQTVLALREPVELAPRGARCLIGRLSIARSQIHRSLDISLEYAPCAEDGSLLAESTTCLYSIAMS